MAATLICLVLNTKILLAMVTVYVLTLHLIGFVDDCGAYPIKAIEGKRVPIEQMVRYKSKTNKTDSCKLHIIDNKKDTSYEIKLNSTGIEKEEFQFYISDSNFEGETCRKGLLDKSNVDIVHDLSNEDQIYVELSAINIYRFSYEIRNTLHLRKKTI